MGALQKRSPNCKSNAMNVTGNCGLATPEKCVTSPHFYKGTFIRSLVSLQAPMSILYLASSQAMSAVRRRAPNPVSCRVRTFQLATTSGLCFIEEFILYFFQPRLGYPCGCGRPPGTGGTGNVWATFSRPLLHWR